MYEIKVQGDFLFYMLYAVVAAMDLIACCYLLLRRGNAFALDVTSSLRLRRWTAAFFGFMALSHVWYFPIAYVTSPEDILLCGLIGGLLDCTLVFPAAITVLFVMLQDRRRPLWPIAVATVPLVVGLVGCLVTRDDTPLQILRYYLLLVGIGLLIYMVREVRRYGRWLRDNYADLEHKEVWHSFLVLATFLLSFGFYVSYLGGPLYEYIVQVNGALVVCYLLWRVETLSDLSSPQSLLSAADEETVPTEEEGGGELELSDSDTDDLGFLLQQRCVDTQLYLQHDLTLSQLAKVIGTNRFYLSQYFSRQGLTYNAYINGLRINYFISHYREVAETLQPFTAQQLAYDSGYRSYSTFSLAFKQRMGQSVTAWMRDNRT